MIQIKLNKTYKNSLNLKVDFKVNQGDIVSIYGKSGVGKTTFLRLLSGLELPNNGLISIGDKTWLNTAKKTNLPIQKRNIGFVFQDYALFPNMTVLQNLKYALPKNKTSKIITELLNEVELFDLKHKNINTLSGGEKQRLALARALVSQPKILLLDEPLSALDNKTRNKLQNFILRIHQKYNLTIFIVTHNIAEIFKLSNKVLLIENGKECKYDTPSNLFMLKQVTNRINLIGLVIKINNSNNIISIKIGSNIHQQKINSSLLKTISVGDEIVLSTEKSIEFSIEKTL